MPCDDFWFIAWGQHWYDVVLQNVSWWDSVFIYHENDEIITEMYLKYHPLTSHFFKTGKWVWWHPFDSMMPQLEQINYFARWHPSFCLTQMIVSHEIWKWAEVLFHHVIYMKAILRIHIEDKTLLFQTYSAKYFERILIIRLSQAISCVGKWEECHGRWGWNADQSPGKSMVNWPVK